VTANVPVLANAKPERASRRSKQRWADWWRATRSSSCTTRDVQGVSVAIFRSRSLSSTC
jgi:hypothetical protein